MKESILICSRRPARPILSLAFVKMLPALVLLSIFLLSAGPARAQGVEHGFQWWQPIYLEAPVINPKIRYYGEVNPRLNDNLQGMNQILLRTALGYNLRKNLAFFQGYAYIGNLVPTYIYENRIYQQLGYGHVIKKRLQVLHRVRNEQRLFSNRDGVSNRMRYMLRLAYPLRSTSFYLVASDELFINVNSLKGGPTAGIDQNRLYAGLGRQINEHMRAEVGYQLQYVNRDDPFDDRAAHVLMTQMFLNF